MIKCLQIVDIVFTVTLANANIASVAFGRWNTKDWLDCVVMWYFLAVTDSNIMICWFETAVSVMWWCTGSCWLDKAVTRWLCWQPTDWSLQCVGSHWSNVDVMWWCTGSHWLDTAIVAWQPLIECRCRDDVLAATDWTPLSCDVLASTDWTRAPAATQDTYFGTSGTGLAWDHQLHALSSFTC